MADIKAEFYQWGVNDIPPDWVTAAIADRTIVTDGDDDSFLVSDAGGRMRINPGDYLMYSMTTIFIVEERVYDAMRAAKRPAASPNGMDAIPDDLGPPPYSATVLARSARARVKQAEWARVQHRVDLHPGHPAMRAEIENAHVEGADVPDEPDLVSPDPPK